MMSKFTIVERVSGSLCGSYSHNGRKTCVGSVQLFLLMGSVDPGWGEGHNDFTAVIRSRTGCSRVD